MLKEINLQLFAEDTIPEEKEDVNLEKEPEGKKESVKNPFEKLIKEGFGKKDPDKKLDGKKTDEEPEDKKPEDVKELETKEPETKKEEEFIPIIHNGKEVKIPFAERQKYLQMGYNYPHIKEESDKAKATLIRIAQVEGFKTVDEYLAELSNREAAKLAEQIEEAQGDPAAIDEVMKNHPRVREAQEKERVLSERERKFEFANKKNELRKEQFFKELEPELNTILEQNPGIDPGTAYTFLLGNYVKTGKLNELMKKTKESAEKKVVADMHDKERRATPTGGDTNEGADIAIPTSTMSEIAKAFGVSAKKVAQRIMNKQKVRR